VWGQQTYILDREVGTSVRQWGQHKGGQGREEEMGEHKEIG